MCDRLPPVVVQLRERTLANVLLDIAKVGPIVWNGDPYSRSLWNDMSHDARGEALDRLAELEAEARAMIESLTGCSWNQISEACL